MMCTDFGDGFFGSGNGGNLDAPGRSRVVHTGIVSADADYCRLYLRAHTIRTRHTSTHVGRRILVSIPINQAGAVFLDEEAKALRMYKVSLLAAIAQHERKLPGLPTYAQLVESFPQIVRLAVELAAPSDTPPAKRIGYYSDGREHTAVVAVSTLGRRLFIESAADDVLSTNVAQHIFGDRL
jgi:hypothetical protein